MKDKKSSQTDGKADIPGKPVPSFEYENLSALTIQKIRKQGFPHQLEALERYLEKHPEAINPVKTELEHLYWKGIREGTKQAPLQAGDHASNFTKYLTRQRVNQNKIRPDNITLKLTRRLLWEAYAQNVWRKSRINLFKVNNPLTDCQKEALNKIAPWLLGIEGGFPINKSLYFWSKVKGTGKSTVLESAFAVMSYFRDSMKWDGRFFEFRSLYQTFYSIRTEGSLSPAQGLGSGNWALDDLRLEYAKLKHYGDDISILALILIIRFDAWVLHGKNTLLASNIAPKDFDKIPDLEVDKMAEQYTPFEFKGSNLRIKNIK